MEDFIKKLDDLKEKYQTGKIDLDTLIHRCFCLGIQNSHFEAVEKYLAHAKKQGAIKP